GHDSYYKSYHLARLVLSLILRDPVLDNSPIFHPMPPQYDSYLPGQCLEATVTWLDKGIVNRELMEIWKRLSRITKGRGCKDVVMVILAALLCRIWNTRNATL
ncbi:hypothetical protein HAX54_038968, partial [Datura stramonium]|nr:hypothetical protein [Datura stramonium]